MLQRCRKIPLQTTIDVVRLGVTEEYELLLDTCLFVALFGDDLGSLL